MNIRNLIIASIAVCVATSPSPSQAATPEVTDVTMTQSGANRLVTITYKLTEDAVVTLDVQTNATPNAATGWASIGGEAICNAQGAVWRKVTSADADGNGNYTITWRPDLSWVDEFGNGFKIADGCAKAVVTAWSLDNTPNYMVVDISDAAQPNTQTYYPSAESIPGGILDNDVYRKTAIVMRKIMAKDVVWTMGSTPQETRNREANREATHQVTLTNNYYIGVFPVTQSQWALIQSNNLTPSFYNNVSYSAMRPVENVCYNEIRNADNTTAANTAYDWPAAPNPSSFLGRLRTKTGIDFDLPSETQWEFAARAGHGSTMWGDGSAILNTNKDDNLGRLGRYAQNGGKVDNREPAQSCDASNGTAIVGTYQPNSWGLYDMHGNVWELCLDWFTEDITTLEGKLNIDPSDSSKTLSGAAGSLRVKRGGGWVYDEGINRPAFRNTDTPTERNKYTGVRLYCTAGLQ